MALLETIDIQQTPRKITPDMILNSDLFLVTLRVGNKSLQLKFHPRVKLFGTFIANNNGAPVEGATTSLYQRAYEIMHEIASIAGYSIRYIYETENQTMIKWAQAQNKGGAVFNWDFIRTNGRTLLAIKNITP